MEFAGYVSIGTLLGIFWVIAELRLMKYQHTLMWNDYKTRHGINGHSKAMQAGD